MALHSWSNIQRLRRGITLGTSEVINSEGHTSRGCFGTLAVNPLAETRLLHTKPMTAWISSQSLLE
jgi:hypothetical protein